MIYVALVVALLLLGLILPPRGYGIKKAVNYLRRLCGTGRINKRSIVKR